MLAVQIIEALDFLDKPYFFHLYGGYYYCRDKRYVKQVRETVLSKGWKVLNCEDSVTGEMSLVMFDPVNITNPQILAGDSSLVIIFPALS